MTALPDATPVRSTGSFDLAAYDARCLALRARLDRLAGLEALGREAALARELPGLLRDLRGHFGQALRQLDREAAAAAAAGAPDEALPEPLRSACDDIALRLDQGGPQALRGCAALCLGLFRQGHARVLEALPPAGKERLAKARRRVRRLALGLLAACACALGLLLAAPALERAWKGFERNNFALDLARDAAERPGLRIAGVYGPEADKEKRWRWGWGTQTIIALELDRPGPVSLDYAVSNPLEGQTLGVSANGELLASHGPLPGVTGMARSVAGSVRFQGREGLNALVITHPLVNHFTFTGDDTPYAVAFLELRLATGLRAGR